jgi:hypothetical protein
MHTTKRAAHPKGTCEYKITASRYTKVALRTQSYGCNTKDKKETSYIIKISDNKNDVP